MKLRDYALTASAALTLIIIWSVTYFELNSVWAFGHVKYLGDFVWYILISLAAIVVLAAFVQLPQEALERIERRVAGWLFSGLILPKALLASGFTALFYFFRVTTAFLGDGYFLLNIFGRNEAYTANLTKPLSIWLIKGAQLFAGGYSYWNALYTFQAASIVSGFFVIYNLVDIAGRLTDSDRGRLFALGTMIGSGWLLLFFGYIEYYPLLWLAASFMVRQAIRCAQDDAGRWTVWLAFVITIGIHMQAVYFLPGVLFLQFSDYLTRVASRISSRTRKILVALALLVPITMVLAAELFLEPIGNPFLLLLPIGAGFPNYTVFSLGNLLEVINLILLVVPSAIGLFVLTLSGGTKPTDRISKTLGLFAYGAFCFLILMNPKLGLARDWDLMSLTLFPPMLLLLYRVRDWNRLPAGPLIATVALSACVTFSYLNANCRKDASEKRFFDLLEHYGNKEKGGWSSLAGFLENDGQREFSKEVADRMAEVFPDHRKLAEARGLMEQGKTEEASLLVEGLVRDNPGNGLFLGTLADIRVNQGQIDEAISLYQSATKTHPNHRNYYCLGGCYLLKGDAPRAIRYLEQAYDLAPQQPEVLAELCRTYATLGKLAPAKKYADELLAIDPHAPDGLVIAIIAAARSGNRTEARRYYREFVQYGRGHPEYEEIKESFAELVR